MVIIDNRLLLFCMTIFGLVIPRAQTLIAVFSLRSFNLLKSGKNMGGSKRKIEESTSEVENTSINSNQDRNKIQEVLNLQTLTPCRLISHPSKIIKSPYVADISVIGEEPRNQHLAHAPGLDCAGIMVNDCTILCKDNRGNEKSKKTTFSIQLISDPRSDQPSTLIGYHPQLAEDLSHSLIEGKLISEVALSNFIEIKKQVTFRDSRVDFVLTTEQQTKIAIEVKNVVCAEYLPLEDTTKAEVDAELVKAVSHVSEMKKKKMKIEKKEKTKEKRKSVKERIVDPSVEYDIFPPQDSNLSSHQHYHIHYPYKCAIFPHGQKKPKLGVVSERAIKHINNLIDLISDRSNDEVEKSVLLFIVNRSDCNAFRPCHESDLLFTQMVRKAINHGVHVIAQQIIWTIEGVAYLGPQLPVIIPKHIREEDIDEKHLQQVLSYEEAT